MIRLNSESLLKREAQARSELQALNERFDLQRWTFTREVRIESGAIPHSQPVLTVNTRYLGDEVGTLATYLHEQFHWFATANETRVNAAIADRRSVFPQVPGKEPEAARSEHSTYLHLIVCMLEYQALSDLFGEAAARLELSEKLYYIWVYQRVLENTADIQHVLKRHGLTLPQRSQ